MTAPKSAKQLRRLRAITAAEILSIAAASKDAHDESEQYLAEAECKLGIIHDDPDCRAYPWADMRRIDSFETNRALVYTIEAAKNLCGASPAGLRVTAKLLRMALKDISEASRS